MIGLTIAIDGSCINNNDKDTTKRKAASAIVVSRVDVYTAALTGPEYLSVNNQIAELNSLKMALEHILENRADYTGIDEVCIVTDSQYIISTFEGNLEKWIKNERTRYANRELINVISGLLGLVKGVIPKLKFTLVRSHTNNNDYYSSLNKIADMNSRRIAKSSSSK